MSGNYFPPAAAAVPPDDTAPILSLGTLPHDLRSKILVDFIGKEDIPTLIHLASTSKSNHARVYRGTPDLWRTIDFSTVDAERRKKITDRTIDALLCSVYAREVTTNLNLFGCEGITGVGLQSLRGSKVLEGIDLRFYGGTCPRGLPTLPDCDVISDVICSMPPIAFRSEGGVFGLKMLRVDRFPYLSLSVLPKTMCEEEEQLRKDISLQMKHLFRSFSIAVASKLEFESTACCRGCNKSVYDKVVTKDKMRECNVYDRFAPRSICFACMGPHCGNDGCIEMNRCDICEKQSCSECEKMMKCGKSICFVNSFLFSWTYLILHVSLTSHSNSNYHEPQATARRHAATSAFTLTCFKFVGNARKLNVAIAMQLTFASVVVSSALNAPDVHWQQSVS